MYYIERNYDGVRCIAPKIESMEDKLTFDYAVRNYSYLVEHGEKIDLESYRWRIAKHCCPSGRTIEVLRVIDRVIN
jgi:hypothetical protein